MRKATLLTFLAAWLLAMPAPADDEQQQQQQLELDELTTIDRATCGTLLLATAVPGLYLPAPTLETDVDFRITGLVARATVSQRFHNPTEQWVEGVYVFPLPENAAVDSLRMVVGERVIEGEIHEREEAKKVYEEAKREGKKASLVEQERPNVFTTSVANVGPGETVVVEIEYQQELTYDDGRFSLRFPLVVAPRYLPGRPSVHDPASPAVPDAACLAPPVMVGDPEAEGARRNAVNIEATLDAGFRLDRLESPSHAVEVVEGEGHRYAIGLADENVAADRDFVLAWQPAPEVAPQAALFSQELDGERFLLLMVLPPRHPTAARLPREAVFVVDTSGSMDGTSIVQARAALLLALDSLAPEDHFNVIRFANDASKLFPESVPASASYLEEARDYVRSLDAEGGTNILGALLAALDDQDVDRGVRQVVFITDGSIGNEAEVLRVLGEQLGKSRLFTVGIGSAPNGYFMRKAAEFGRGTFTYIGDVSEVGERMGRLFVKLESPFLADLEVAWDDPLAEAWPERPGDLYRGEPLQVVARLPSGGDGVEVSGWTLDQPWKRSFDIAGGEAASGLDKLWARRKIEALTDRAVRGTPEDEVRRQVIEVALRHHLVSKYTSLVAVDPVASAPPGTVPETRPLPVHLPAGWTERGLNGQQDVVRLPRTGTGATFEVLLGILLAVLGGVVWLAGRRT